jgi:hypothetical protein
VISVDGAALCSRTSEGTGPGGIPAGNLPIKRGSFMWPIRNVDIRDPAIHVRQADDYVLGRQDCRAGTAGQTIVIEAIRELAGQAVDMLAGEINSVPSATWSHQTPV